MNITQLIDDVDARVRAYDKGEKWYPATRQQVVDLLEACQELQRLGEAKGYELEAALRQLAIHRP